MPGAVGLVDGRALSLENQNPEIHGNPVEIERLSIGISILCISTGSVALCATFLQFDVDARAALQSLPQEVVHPNIVRQGHQKTSARDQMSSFPHTGIESIATFYLVSLLQTTFKRSRKNIVNIVSNRTVGP